MAGSITVSSSNDGIPPPDQMMETKMRKLMISLVALAALSNVALAESPWENPATPPPAHEEQTPSVEKNLKVFDTLDFDVFSNQKWDRLTESHSKDIVVTMPDGHETVGLDKHIEVLKGMFVFAPDMNIKEHPIRFGSGSWTTATGILTGTFSKPMPIGGGKSIPATNKHFVIGMVTVGHWVNGVMDHEWLFWDNGDFMKQMGLGK